MPAPSRTHTTTRVSPRQWSALFSVPRARGDEPSERAHRDIAGPAGAGAPCGGMDDGSRAGGKGGPLPGLAFRRIDTEDALRSSRRVRLQAPVPLAACLVVLGR